jgi:ribosomal protein S18 acetylase RimI-like enzyme
MLIRRLTSSDAATFQALRLAGLRECPTAFSSSADEESDTPLAVIEARLAPGSGRNIFGAFDGEQLTGIVGVGRDTSAKLRHRASIRGMYVPQSQRGKGIGRQLMRHALAFTGGLDGLLHVTLSVTAGNDIAIGLYASMGFTVAGHEPGALLVEGVLYDNLLMVKPAG